jgi:hypothetical protein
MKKNLIHCSYHKCLTVYFIKVASAIYNRIYKFSNGYTHFNSRVDEFYKQLNDYSVASVNNHALDFSKLGNNFRISRFIRDPRDLVVSGYLYHKKGKEPWTEVKHPTESDWAVVNGATPPALPAGHSYAGYLQNVSKEEGLMAEIDFRKYHFRSMLEWPDSDKRIKLFRYEDIMGNEADVFEALFAHYGVSWPTQKMARFFGDRHSAKKKSGSMKHIRNPSSGQWKQHFTPKVEAYFMEQYEELLNKYGYV